MQGLPEETDQGSVKNTIPLGVGKRSGKRSMRRKVSSVAESGTCNVCSAPCSSCMHLKLARMGTKGGEMSDETCHLPATSQNSINDNPQCAGSETSNLVSVNSNHDTFSENAKNKIHIRSSEVADASIESKMLLKLMSEITARGDQIGTEMQCSLEQRSFSNKLEDSKPMEGLDDNISCVSRVNDGSTVVSYSRKNADKKNLLPSLDSGHGEAASVAVNQEKSANHSRDCFTSDKSTIDKYAGTMCIKLEAEDRVSSDQPDDVLDCLQKVGEEKKSNELPDSREPALQSVPENDSDESEILEHDVKVCDICGDVGREDLLAVCSQCTDGAEHTYCMREMLQKVPEGDWLCEECNQTEEIRNRKQDAEEKTVRKENFQSSATRRAESTEMISFLKRQAVETSSGPLRSPSSGRTPLLESSFKSLDKGKIRSAYQSSSGAQSSEDLLEMAHTSTGSRLQNQKGILSKSSSFSSQGSKPKVGITDEITQKFRGSRESYLEMNEPSKVLSKSMSSKSVNSGRSSASEPKVKMLPLQFSHAPEKKGSKPIIERNAFDKKSLSRIDRPQGISIAKVDQKLTPRGDAVMRSSMSISKEMKVSHLGGKVGNLSRSNSYVSRKGTELQVMSARASSGNDVNASIDSREYQTSPKDEPSSSPSCNPGTSSINDSENLSECSPRPRDSLIKGEKAKGSSGSRLKPSGLISPQIMPCKQCKEFGHVAEYCAKSGLGKMSGNKLKAAIEAAMLKKPGIYRKKRESEQPDGLSASNVNGSVSLASQDRCPGLSEIKELSSDEDKTEGKANLRMPFSESLKQNSTSNLKHLSAVDTCLPVKVEDSDSSVHSVRKSNLASVSPFLTTQTFVIPEHEYIWQGAFEVCRSGRYLELCGGIQAHLSTCASPKVLEVVKRFPHQLTLDEVPRPCTWPRQFHTDGAKEDNIALFFFAKDVGSFEKHYSGLLDNMIRKDLALKGSFDGVDLLIFPSAQLPKCSQRWNTLFFLWGVFRGRNSNCLESSKTPVASTVSQETEKSSAVTSVHDDSCLAEAVYKESSGEVILKECKSDMLFGSSMQTSGVACVAISQVESRTERENSPSRGNSLSSKVNGSGDQESFDQGSQHAMIGSHRSTVKVERDLNEGIEDMNSESAPERRDLKTQVTENWHGNRRKRPYLDLSEEVSHTSVGTSDKMQLDKVACLPTESESSKKSKLGSGELYGSSCPRDEISLEDRLVSQVCDLTTSSSEDNCRAAYDDRVIQPKVGSSEGFFFPMELDNVNGLRSGSGVPNLELALGVDTNTSNKVMFPFLVGMPENNRRRSHSKSPDKIPNDEEEPVSASLSLSLSFPFPEPTVSPEPKTEQHAPDSRSVDTSLFIFGGLSDK